MKSVKESLEAEKEQKVKLEKVNLKKYILINVTKKTSKLA